MIRAGVDHAPYLERAFSGEPREGSWPIEEIEGRIPSFVRGTGYSNGPARFARGGFRYGHWLDGDGMVAALRFDGTGARLTCRFVRTRKLVEEEAAGRPLFRTFGTAFPGDRLVRGVALASPANVSVVPFGNALLALGEQGLPWRLDPVSLETRGEETFGGELNEVTPFAAHAKLDAATGELVGFGVSYAGAESQLHLYRFDRQGALACRRRLRLEHPCSVHDFGLSERFAVFHLGPYLLDVERLVRGGASVMDALCWRPELGSRLRIVSRESGQEAASVALDGAYCLHLVNCFERGEDVLVVDLVEYERPLYDQYRPLPDLFPDAPRGRPTRFVIDLRAGAIRERRTIAYDRAPDFPAIDTRRAQRACGELWMLGLSAAGRPGRKFFDELVHARWDEPERPVVFTAPKGRYFAGEPVFIPEPGERPGGLLLCPVFDAAEARSSFLLFDAHDIPSGPLATLRLPHPLRLGFHAVFRPEV